jgi:cell division septation protein DedD
MPSRKSKDKKKRKRYRLEFSLASFFFWGLGSLFFLGWIFVLGILVGRGFLPQGVSALSKLRIPITKLQDVVSNRKEPDLNQIEGLNQDPEFKFYDELSSKKSKVTKKNQYNVENPESKTTAGNQIETGNSATIEKQVKGIGQSIVRESEGLTPQEVEAVTSGNGWKYAVQVASVDSRAEAGKIADRLRSQGYPAYFYEVKVRGKTYYRVRCGRFSDKKEANEIKQRLAEEKKIQGFVTKELAEKPGEITKRSVNRPDTALASEPTKKNNYTVQIASLENKKEALKMVGRLKNGGYSVYLHQINIRNRTYYRVRCGSFKDQEAARDYQSLLARQESIKGFVTKMEN